MTRISYKRHRFPVTLIQHAIGLDIRFTFSLRDMVAMLARRGLIVFYETIRVWTTKLGPEIAANPRRRKLQTSPRWHLDGHGSGIGGERGWIRGAADDEGEVMNHVVRQRRDAGALFDCCGAR